MKSMAAYGGFYPTWNGRKPIVGCWNFSELDEGTKMQRFSPRDAAAGLSGHRALACQPHYLLLDETFAAWTRASAIWCAGS